MKTFFKIILMFLVIALISTPNTALHFPYKLSIYDIQFGSSKSAVEKQEKLSKFIVKDDSKPFKQINMLVYNYDNNTAFVFYYFDSNGSHLWRKMIMYSDYTKRVKIFKQLERYYNGKYGIGSQHKEGKNEGIVWNNNGEVIFLADNSYLGGIFEIHTNQSLYEKYFKEQSNFNMFTIGDKLLDHGR